jgi:2,4-dienoyl-CoA reductase-like NADH-dependent reductase (Old Yellow Enzyme family)
MELAQRFAMAPMTRSRAKVDGTPGDLATEYYAQRAAAGLMISEGTQPSDDGQGYLHYSRHLHRCPCRGLAQSHLRRARQGGSVFSSS